MGLPASVRHRGINATDEIVGQHERRFMVRYTKVNAPKAKKDTPLLQPLNGPHELAFASSASVGS